MKRIIAIAAMDEAGVIGCKGKLPWDLPADLALFRKLTTGHAVLMGRKTWESLPARARPLPGRLNIVVTSRPLEIDAPAEVLRFSSPADAIAAFLAGDPRFTSDLLWVIGGGRIYHDTLRFWDEVCLTLVHGNHEGDVFFPDFKGEFEIVERKDEAGYSVMRYKRKRGEADGAVVQ